MRDRLVEIIREAPTAEFLMRMADRFVPHNPETYKESESPGPGINVEYPTWLALQRPVPRSDGGPMEYRIFAEVEELLQEMFRLTSLNLQFAHLRERIREPTVEDEVIAFSRTYELTARSSGYIVHLAPLLEALFTDEGDLEGLVRFSIGDLLTAQRAVELHAWDRFSTAIGGAMERVRKTARDILRGKADAQIRTLIPREYLRRMSTQTMRQVGALPLIHEERGKVLAQAEELCTVTPAWLADQSGVPEDKCRRILERFALPFGQAAIADNLMSRYEPLEARPLVGFPDGRYLPHLMHLWHWGTRANLEEALKADPASWARYERRRARYLEDRAVALLGKMLPGSRVERRLRYRMTNEAGREEEFELDGLVSYGPVLFLIEGKAGPVSHAALRGATASLRQDLRDLIGDAHRQAIRARAYVTSRDSATLTRPDGSDFDVARASHPEIYMVTVTLEALEVFVMRLGQLREMGIVGEGDLPWAVSLLDLEVIADLVEWGPQLVHYLRRRLPLNRKDVVAVEELDFFATYLVDGLDVARHLDGKTFVQVATTRTQPMDAYYLHRWGVRETPADRPRMKLSQKTRQAIEEAARAEPSAALEAVCKLLDDASAARRQ